MLLPVAGASSLADEGCGHRAPCGQAFLLSFTISSLHKHFELRPSSPHNSLDTVQSTYFCIGGSLNWSVCAPVFPPSSPEVIYSGLQFPWHFNWIALSSRSPEDFLRCEIRAFYFLVNHPSWSFLLWKQCPLSPGVQGPWAPGSTLQPSRR